jgi:hypothetical protein
MGESFERAIQEHLELKRRNSHLDQALALSAYLGEQGVADVEAGNEGAAFDTAEWKGKRRLAQPGRDRGASPSRSSSRSRTSGRVARSSTGATTAAPSHRPLRSGSPSPGFSSLYEHMRNPNRCPDCGEQVSPFAAGCAKCGTSLDRTAAAIRVHSSGCGRSGLPFRV